MFVKFISAAALLAALGSTGAVAQSRSGPVIPAEMPPASYAGAQYVDSRGCIFIRAGFNGRVNWVPRYGDDRRPMCGYAPSTAGSPAAAPVAAPVAVASAPVAPAPRTVPAPRATVSSGIPYSVPPETSRPRVRVAAPAPQPAQVYQAGARGLDTRWSFYDRTGPSPCTNLSPHSQMYMVPSPALPELPLRCGPQERHTTDAVREMAPRGNVWEPWDGVNPSPMAPNVYQLPPAYAPRWPDAHLQQPAAPQGHTAPAPRVAQATAPRATLSTMGTAAPATTTAAAGRYVQIGTFGVSANAQNTIARLQQRGLPVATGSVQRGGQPLQVVMAGPFTNPSEAQAALGTARALGFGDAFLR